jgi:ribosomal protein L12E/L44/L45/RPP1/RPP2
MNKPDITTLTNEQLDDIIDRTEYTIGAVAIGDAAADQDLRAASEAELAKRMGLS